MERTWPALMPTAMPERCLTSFGILAVGVVVLSVGLRDAEVFDHHMQKRSGGGNSWVLAQSFGLRQQPISKSEVGSGDLSSVT